jgi:hypothetical protein
MLGRHEGLAIHADVDAAAHQHIKTRGGNDQIRLQRFADLSAMPVSVKRSI